MEDESNPTYKVNPEYVGTLFRDHIMPLTKEVEVAYLLARLDQGSLGKSVDELNVDWVSGSVAKRARTK